MTSIVKKKIFLTGGGTAGHVMPHIALLPQLLNEYDVHYIGSSGIEKSLIDPFGIRFHTISVGKLRRYLSLDNIKDVFKVILGVLQAYLILRREKPSLVFSKGGFVSVPVAVAARCLRIPVISHESDFTPGLANRIIARFAKTILLSFSETKKAVPSGKLVGVPIRTDLHSGQRSVGFEMCGFNPSDKSPVVLVMGGSQGAQSINDALQKSLPKLLCRYRVIHLCGRGKALDFEHENYCSFEFLGPELKDIFAAADLVVSRAGANSIFELKAMAKPMLLIPLVVGSRGDQVDNAKSFENEGWAKVLDETNLSDAVLIEGIDQLNADAEAMITLMNKSKAQLSPDKLIFDEIRHAIR